MSLTDFAKNIFGVDESPVLAPIDITNIELSEEQMAMYETMERKSTNMFITGKAGTGKSVLLQYFRTNTTKNVVVVAPTGIAAMNVGGQTIHSLFKLPLGLITPQSIKKDNRVAKILGHIDCVVIDEISMVRADCMDGIDMMLRYAKKSDQPFGGTQIIMFGDVFQLPPVIAERELYSFFRNEYGGYYFFDAHVWKTTSFSVYELTDIFRQKDSTFTNLLNAIRNGAIDYELFDEINKRVSVDAPTKGAVFLVPTNAQVDAINSQKLALLPGKTHTFQAKVDGDFDRSAYPTEEFIQLKKGAQVILLKNDKDKRWVNGSIGYVQDLSADTITVSINGQSHDLEKQSWNKIKYEYNEETKKIEEKIIGSFSQFPIRLAWAITIHKSQGQSYDKVVIDLGRGSFAHGQTYVALSRVRSLEGLYLTRPIQSKDIIVDQKIIDFMR